MGRNFALASRLQGVVRAARGGPMSETKLTKKIAKADHRTTWCLRQNFGLLDDRAPISTRRWRATSLGPPRILAWGPELPGAGRDMAAALRALGFRDRQPAATWPRNRLIAVPI
jgi:hypothetical protein